jgi:predicted membrane protein
MKMGPSIFWGVLLIVIGLSLVIKIVFNIDFPIFKVIFAFLFIYIGLKILLGHSFKPFHEKKTDTEVIFGESSFNNVEDGKEYNVVFSKGNFDLRNIPLREDGPTRVKINTVFGGARVIIDKNKPIRIKTDAVFSDAKMPNGNSTAFGSTVYTSDSLDFTKPFLDVKADVVFGGIDVVAM